MENTEKQYTLNGEMIESMIEFINVNEFNDLEIQQIHSLPVNESLFFGGGAAAEFELKRVN